MPSPPPPGFLSAVRTAAQQQSGPTSLDLTDPIASSFAWDTYEISGTPAPGVIALDGIRGFDRETAWDRKRGKGQRGAVLTLTQRPLAEGTITSWLWLSRHFSEWDAFLEVLSYYSDKQSITNAAQIDHPALAKNNVQNVVVGKVGIIRHVGKKLYSVTVEYIEWSPPPSATVVNTPLKAAELTASTIVGNPPPAVAAAQARMFQASAEHAAAQGR